MKDRWPLGLVTVGLGELVWVSLRGNGPSWIDPMAWAIAAAFLCVVASVWWVTGSQHARHVFVPTLIMFAVIRSGDYLILGVHAPLGDWLVVAGLILQLSVSHDQPASA